MIFLFGVTSDLPTKVAPSSITRRAAFRSPINWERECSSQRSCTVMLPCTLPFTITVLLFTSPRTSAFSPTVRTPSTDEISPSRFPSKTNSFANLIEPLISTSFERLFLLGVSAITGVGCVTILVSAAGGVGGSSPGPASSTGGVCPGLWGINFFSTLATMKGAKSSVNDRFQVLSLGFEFRVSAWAGGSAIDHAKRETQNLKLRSSTTLALRPGRSRFHLASDDSGGSRPAWLQLHGNALRRQ